MSVALIVPLWQAAAQTAQRRIAPILDARFTKGGQKVAHGKSVSAHQDVKVNPVARFGPQRGNQTLGLEQFVERRHSNAALMRDREHLRQSGIRDKERNLHRLVDDEILLVIVQSNPFSMLFKIRSTESRARSVPPPGSSNNSAHSARTRSNPNSSAISSNRPNRGRSRAARMYTESAASGLDQTNPGCFCQN